MANPWSATSATPSSRSSRSSPSTSAGNSVCSAAAAAAGFECNLRRPRLCELKRDRGCAGDGAEPGDDAILGDALIDQVPLHRLGAMLSEVLAAGALGVADDHEAELGPALEHRQHAAQREASSVGDAGMAGLEPHGGRQRGGDVGGEHVGTAVGVLVAVEGLGLVGTRILRVENAVAVVVGIGAAVGVLEAILVLGLIGALVGGADDAVAVGVVDRAAVRTGAASLVGAGVEPIRNAVAVAVAIRIGARGDDRRRGRLRFLRSEERRVGR